VFCLLVVLVKLSVLAKWLARKTLLRKPNRGEGIVSRKLRPKSAHDFLGLLYCFIVLLCICVVSCPYLTYFPTVMARYSLFVLKVPLNPSKQTNKSCGVWAWASCDFRAWALCGVWAWASCGPGLLVRSGPGLHVGSVPGLLVVSGPGLYVRSGPGLLVGFGFHVGCEVERI